MISVHFDNNAPFSVVKIVMCMGVERLSCIYINVVGVIANKVN